MTRRKFTYGFRTEAARLVTERGVAVAQVARGLPKPFVGVLVLSGLRC